MERPTVRDAPAWFRSPLEVVGPGTDRHLPDDGVDGDRDVSRRLSVRVPFLPHLSPQSGALALGTGHREPLGRFAAVQRGISSLLRRAADAEEPAPGVFCGDTRGQTPDTGRPLRAVHGRTVPRPELEC